MWRPRAAQPVTATRAAARLAETRIFCYSELALGSPVLMQGLSLDVIRMATNTFERDAIALQRIAMTLQTLAPIRHHEVARILRPRSPMAGNTCGITGQVPLHCMRAVVEMHPREVVTDEPHGSHLETLPDHRAPVIGYDMTADTAAASELSDDGNGSTTYPPIGLLCGTRALKNGVAR